MEVTPVDLFNRIGGLLATKRGKSVTVLHQGVTDFEYRGPAGLR
jgi:hypothetical protein